MLDKNKIRADVAGTTDVAEMEITRLRNGALKFTGKFRASSTEMLAQPLGMLTAY